MIHTLVCFDAQSFINLIAQHQLHSKTCRRSLRQTRTHLDAGGDVVSLRGLSQVRIESGLDVVHEAFLLRIGSDFGRAQDFVELVPYVVQRVRGGTKTELKFNRVHATKSAALTPAAAAYAFAAA